MSEQQQIRFDDGDAYERAMGVWSRSAGEVFLDWLAPGKSLRWLDVGCGSGAFTELIVQRCAPAEAQGIDPSEEQLAFARKRPAASVARFQQGDAMALPYANDSFDAAAMALVLFFVPETRQARRRDGTRGSPRRTGRRVFVGLRSQRLPVRADPAELRAMGGWRRPCRPASRRPAWTCCKTGLRRSTAARSP